MGQRGTRALAAWGRQQQIQGNFKQYYKIQFESKFYDRTIDSLPYPAQSIDTTFSRVHRAKGGNMKVLPW